MSGIPVRRRASRAAVASKRTFSHRTETLEPRLLLATFTVLNNGDTGAGSLRQAILDANAAIGADIINFAITGGGVQTITPATALPAVTDPVTIDGYTQPGASANTLAIGDNAKLTVVIDGISAPAGANGITIDAANSTVRGLVIDNFKQSAAGALDGAGVFLTAKADTVVVAGNFLGADATGAAAKGNHLGVLDEGTHDLVGGTTPAARNIISGNDTAVLVQGAAKVITFTELTAQPVDNLTFNGVNFDFKVAGVDSTDATFGGVGPGSLAFVKDPSLEGNATGTLTLNFTDPTHILNFGVVLNAVVPTITNGAIVQLFDASDNPIESDGVNLTTLTTFPEGRFAYFGTTPVKRAVVTFNSVAAARFALDNLEFTTAAGGQNNSIQGNYIGPDATGTTTFVSGPFPVQTTGVTLFGNGGNSVGGTVAGAGNVISGNFTSGVTVDEPGAAIQGNIIGLNATGDGQLGNGTDFGIGGVALNSSNATVGGTTAAARNIISGNGDGVSIDGSNNIVQGNYIGTDITGSIAKLNETGVHILSGTGNIIGGTTPGAGNVLSGNNTAGVSIRSDSNTVSGNLIGTDASGTKDVGNSGDGVAVFVGTKNLIGGASAGARNIISGNGEFGVEFFAGAMGNTAQGNYIGTDVSGTLDLGNGESGVYLKADNSTVGGSNPGQGNLISGNGNHGIRIDVTANGDVIQGNFIGTDASGNAALGNDLSGIFVSTSSGFTIGGSTPGARNVISGNTNNGISVDTGGLVAIHGNLIGTNAAGTATLGNGGNGVNIFDSSFVGVGPDSSVAPLDNAAANVISGNKGDGVTVSGTSHDIFVMANFIGTDTSGKLDLGNAGSGVAVKDSASFVWMGDLNVNAGNTIAFNGHNGITITGTGFGNLISRNSIFENDLLGIDLGNDGVSPNDTKDPDTGPNNLQNWPVLSFVTSEGGSTTIAGFLNSLPNTKFQIQFFTADSVDLSGNGEGKQYIGNVELTTDPDGNLNFAKSFPFTLSSGKVVTATAINLTNNDTSEFSNAKQVSASGPGISISDVTKAEGNSGTTQFVFTVTLSNPSSNTITVDYDTQDGTAQSFADFPGDQVDYIRASGTVTFNPGQTSKTVTVYVNGDTTVEPDETFAVQLRDARSSSFSEIIPIDKVDGIGTIVNDDVVASGPAVTTFDLINADTGAVIRTISEGDTLNLATLPAHLAVRADTSPGTVGSVKFGYDQTAGSFNANYRVENLVPYALFADNTHGKFFSGTFTLGGHTLVATPFTAAGAKGTAGTAKTVHFTVIGSSGPSISSFTLVNADTDKDIMALTDGITLTLASLPTTHLSIRVNTSPSPTGSVKLGYDQVAGTFNANFRVENLLPYALFGDDIPGNYNVGVLTAGNHTLTATPFTASAAKGTAGAATTIHFKVV